MTPRGSANRDEDFVTQEGQAARDHWGKSTLSGFFIGLIIVVVSVAVLAVIATKIPIIYATVLTLLLAAGLPIFLFTYALFNRSNSKEIFYDDRQRVTIVLHDCSIDSKFYNAYELDHFYSQLQIALGNNGEVVSPVVTDGGVQIALLGNDAEYMFKHVGRVFRHASISDDSTIFIRSGPAGFPERRVHMAN